MTKGFFTPVRIARASVIAALYFVLTFLLQPVSYGFLQFRAAEALTLLPVIFPEAAIGVSIGCLLANIFSPFGWYDMIFGTLATAVAALLTYLIGKRYRAEKLVLIAASLPPVAVNALILPLVWLIFEGGIVYFTVAGQILLSQAVSVMLLGIPLVLALKKAGLDK